jgi:hypothetical protein
MIRLLIIGRPADEWAQRLRREVGRGLDVDTARLPSAGIRQFESTPADLIIVADDHGGPRVETLARAIRKRPLGELVPLMMICPLPEDGDVARRLRDLDLIGWHPPEAEPADLVSSIEEALHIEPGELASQVESSDQVVAPDHTDDGDDGGASYFDGDVVLEPLDEPGTPSRRLKKSAIFRGPTAATDNGDALSPDEITRTLKAVRHEDYYAILRLRRGAETQTVRQAFHRLYERFDPQTMNFELVRRFQDELDEIRDALEDAFAVLGDPDLREVYLQHTLNK